MDMASLKQRVLDAGLSATVASAVVADSLLLTPQYRHPPGDHVQPIGELSCPSCVIATPKRVEGFTSKVTDVEVGWHHALALLDDGTAVAWGANESGELGDGTTKNRSKPKEVPGLARVVSIACGSSHSAVVDETGTVFVWGGNWNGQLGTGNSTDLHTPTSLLVGPARSVYAWGDVTMILLRDGTVKAWGKPASHLGSLGDGSHAARNSPVDVVGLTDVETLVVSYDSAFAKRTDGSWWTWGCNDNGQLADGIVDPDYDIMSDQPQSLRTARPVPALLIPTNCTQLASGSSHVASLVDGLVMTLGWNFNGPLGDGTTENRRAFALMQLPEGVRARSIFAGFSSTYVVLDDGTLRSCGMNSYGQLGDGTLQDRSVVVTSSIRGVTKVSAQMGSVAALDDTGNVWQWAGGELEPAKLPKLKPRSSKFGGTPDLPKGAKWPTWNKQPLAFLAQIDLAALPALSTVPLLPAQGLLCFFVSPALLTDPSPAESGAAFVVYTEPSVAVGSVKIPNRVDDSWRFAETPMSVTITGSIADPKSNTVAALQLSPNDDDRYSSVFSSYREERMGGQHRVFGYEDAVQEPNNDDLVLLLQMDSDARLALGFGDGGRIYFWITPKDLADKRFDRVICTHQQY